jgi:hypothetical protein
MRAILIDPNNRTVTAVEMPDLAVDLAEALGGPIKLMLGMPGGANVCASDGAPDASSFSMGGSEAIKGRGLVVGRRGRFGIFESTRAHVDSVASITRFSPTRRRGISGVT